MPLVRRLAVLISAVAAVFHSRIASARTVADPETRVWDFGFLAAAFVRENGFGTADITGRTRLRTAKMRLATLFWQGMGQLVGGAFSTGGGAAVETVGFGFDSTGVGSLVGIPANLAGAVMIANGISAMAASAANTAAASGALASTGGGGGSDSGRLLGNAVQPFKGGPLTRAGRALTKHPELLGYTKETLRTALRTDAEINAAAENALGEILKGTPATTTLPRYGAVLEFKGANGFGARFHAETGEFIGFINP